MKDMSSFMFNDSFLEEFDSIDGVGENDPCTITPVFFYVQLVFAILKGVFKYCLGKCVFQGSFPFDTEFHSHVLVQYYQAIVLSIILSIINGRFSRYSAETG